MARRLRVKYAGALYHVMNRGDRRGPAEPQTLKAIRRGWCLGRDAFREEFLEPMSHRLGEHHGVVQRPVFFRRRLLRRVFDRVGAIPIDSRRNCSRSATRLRTAPCPWAPTGRCTPAQNSQPQILRPFAIGRVPSGRASVDIKLVNQLLAASSSRDLLFRRNSAVGTGSLGAIASCFIFSD